MRMIHGCPSRFAMIFEDQDVPEALVVLQIQHAVAVCPKHVFESALGNCRKRSSVVWRFNDDFMCADAIHLVEQSFPFAIKLAFDFQSGKFVGNNANGPAWSISSATISSVDKELRRRFGFVSRTEWAIFWIASHNLVAQKIHGPFAAVGRDNDPTPCDGIFP